MIRYRHLIVVKIVCASRTEDLSFAPNLAGDNHGRLQTNSATELVATCCSEMGEGAEVRHAVRWKLRELNSIAPAGKEAIPDRLAIQCDGSMLSRY